MTSRRPPSDPPVQGASNRPTPLFRKRLLWALLAAGLFAIILRLAVGKDPETPEASGSAGTAGDSRSQTGTSANSGDPAVVELRLRTVPDTASILIDGVSVGTGAFNGTVPRRTEGHQLTVRAAGYKERNIQIFDRPPSLVHLSPESADDGSATSGDEATTAATNAIQLTPARQPRRRWGRAARRPAQATAMATPNNTPATEAPRIDVAVTREPIAAQDSETAMTAPTPTRTPTPSVERNRPPNRRQEPRRPERASRTDNINPWAD